MFGGTLGTWEKIPVDLELKEHANLKFSRPYPVLKLHKQMFKKELKRLVILGVLRKVK